MASKNSKNENSIIEKSGRLENIENIKKGEFIKKKEGAKKTYTKGNYCRTNKGWECVSWDDISDFIYIKKGKAVYVGFDF